MGEVGIFVVNMNSISFDVTYHLELARILQKLLEIDGVEVEIFRKSEEAVNCQTLIFFSMADKEIAFKVKEKFPNKNIAVASGWITEIENQKGVSFLPKDNKVLSNFIKMHF